MPLDLHHLAVFHAVAEAGGVTAGAERLMVSQPAVSKQLKSLARGVGVALLERRGRGVRLTPAGETLAGYARRIFALAAEAEAALADLEALRAGTLSVGAGPVIGTYLLPEVLVYFRQRFPGVRVRVEIAGAAALRGWLEEDAIDLVLADEAIASDRIERRAFASDPLVPVARPRHPLAARRRITLAELCREPFVAGETGSPTRALFERYVADAGLSLDNVLTLGSTEAVKRAVMHGLGVAVVSRLSVAGELAAKRLVALRVPELALARPLYEAWSKSRKPGKLARAFHCVLEHAVRGTLPKPRSGRRPRPPSGVKRPATPQ